MNPDTHDGLIRAANACEAAGIVHAGAMLRLCAESPKEWYEDEPEVWLSRAAFACDCFFYSALDADTPRAGLCTDAGTVCERERDAAMRRRLGLPPQSGSAKCDPDSDSGTRAA